MIRTGEMYQGPFVDTSMARNRGKRKGKIFKGVALDDLPDDRRCPNCGAGRKAFRPLAGPGSTVAEGI